jgi:hypothetical protein
MPDSQKKPQGIVPRVCSVERSRLLVSRPEMALVWLDFAI